MKLEALGQMNITVGTKSLIRRLNAGEVREVFLAEDADMYLKKKLSALCEEKGVPVNEAPSMLALGQACGVKIGTAAVGVLK